MGLTGKEISSRYGDMLITVERTAELGETKAFISTKQRKMITTQSDEIILMFDSFRNLSYLYLLENM